MLAMKPNEFGDFLAGVFSPVAFLWLVLGFIQQGHELSLQIAELRHSIAAQNDLVVATRDQRAIEAIAANCWAQALTRRCQIVPANALRSNDHISPDKSVPLS
jgi:hypothetical protein